MRLNTAQISPFDPSRWLCSVEGDPPPAAGDPPAAPPAGDPPADPPVAPPAASDPPATPPADASWRDSLKSEDAKKFAESSPDVDHLVARALDMRKQLSNAIIPPGKDAKPEEVAAYHRKIGVPEAPDGYEIARPEHMPEEMFNSEPVQANLKAFRERMHAAGMPAAQFKAAIDTYWEIEAAATKAIADADKRFAEQAEADLRRAWPGKEYDTNKEHAARAMDRMFGDQATEFRNIETKDGRFIADHPIMLKALAAFNREMEEADTRNGNPPPLSPSDKAAVDEQLTSLRTKASEAQARGDNREANRLYQEEQALIAKSKGNQSIVGAGRAA